MKKGLLLIFLVLTCLVPLACRVRTPLSPAPITPTPTVNSTPICGMTPITGLYGPLALADSGIQVIKTTAQWDNFVAQTPPYISLTPTPTPSNPPVNFTSQMIITAGVPEPCDNTSVSITNVCESPSQVTVYVTSTTCTTCPYCNMASEYTDLESMVAVPFSNAPVSVVTTSINN